jgi:glycosyltransferase involved in cell wall biosynthesis
MPDLSVVICSLNGAAGVDRCLGALAAQTIAPAIEVVVVDDGSTDDTSAIARSHGAVVVRHEVNRGLSAARNSGVLASHAPIVAFLDDDCQPDLDWARQLLSAYEDGVMGVGGSVVPTSGRGILGRYLERNNPLSPLEIDLGRSDSPLYRFVLYLRRMWSSSPPQGRRPVFSLVGAGMSFRRQALLDAGLFDTRFTFGAEELDLCRRLARAHPRAQLVLEPAARVVHEFEPSLRDMLRRSRAYGRGSARMYRKWPSVNPTFFPLPVATAVLLAFGAAVWAPLALAALAAPHVVAPGGLRGAVRHRDPTYLLDPYFNLAQETWEDIGFVHGLWAYRDLEPEGAS